ncbi:MAG: ribonuclease HI family protein [Oligoflexia bacterium]|nr:ribonuclease HI family protein [Oligoflexia bacterium]
MWPKKVFIYTDGASRGNPGPCALGLQVFDSKKNLIYEEASYLEDQNTNNFAEYKAVIRAFELAVQNEIQELTLFSDSELLIRQLQKKYKVKSPNIRTLFQECQSFLKHIPQTYFQHIPREQNKGADALANQALDNKG